MSANILYIAKQATSRKAHTYLESLGYTVARVEGLRGSLRGLVQTHPDLIVIDAGESSWNNIERITHAAGRRPNNPYIILLISDRESIPANVRHDAYLVRPYTPRRLEKAIRELLAKRQDAVIKLGPLVLDRRTQYIRSERGLCRLTPKQFQLIELFMVNPCKLLTRRQLMQDVWNTNYLGDTRTLDVHIRWLRECIEVDPNAPTLILTTRGRGYILQLEGEPEIGGEPLIVDDKASASSPSSAPPITR